MKYRSSLQEPPRAKKSLGQHFLSVPAISERIVKLLDPPYDGERILEIGPGPGALTSLLRNRHPSVLRLLEKDDYWAAHHASISCDDNGIQEVIHGDALVYPWEQLESDWKIIGNLPYNIASPLMWDIVSRIQKLNTAVFMIQKEVAQRVCALSGCREYGALSVWIQSYASASFCFSVAPGAFSPPPKVDSAVILLRGLPPEQRPSRPHALSETLKLCFRLRRKQLGSILSRVTPNGREIPARLNLCPEIRPETLSPRDFQRLAAELFPDADGDVH
ncbi:MAG: 16S rRNA (adenine(1518)-N(6)/adenine(1519)-N(6))-dimethyltransferase RsmA [Desulfovibrionaceae bacterium]|nr:16S rRNA (adenine(1518)-N(6)/adenine(1519)-N(6))-dimethyltransferase RsmA [Desulfovibrionaceae bacterium]